MSDPRRPPPDRDTCPRCGSRIGLHTTVKIGDVTGRFAVTTACPNTVLRLEGGREACRQPTAILFDRYGFRVIFAPTFEALNHRIALEAGNRSRETASV